MKQNNKKNNLFEWILIFLAIITAGIVGYENLMQKYIPGNSILNHFHRYGYFKEYSIIYEPSKGIWHTVGWTGSTMMIVMMLYSVRKRVALFESMKYITEVQFHLSLLPFHGVFCRQ